MRLKNQTEQGNFKKYKGTLDKLYSDERTLIQTIGGRKAYYDPNRVNSREELTKTFITNLNNPEEASKVSETLIGINGIYAEIIQYYVNLPLYRYTVIPGQVKKLRESGAEEKYEVVYEKMTSIVDGISLEVNLPKILQTGLIYGIIYMYIDKDQSSETIETLMLPNSYCRKGFTTNFGTDTVNFDFKFFDDIKSKLGSSSALKITEEDLLELFPATLIQQYKKYQKNKDLRWQELDPKVSAAISFSPNSMPPKLYANYGIIDYEVLRRNEVIRSNNELEKILVHEIPHTADGNLMFEMDEALEIHDSMAKALSGVKGLKLLTTFGGTSLIELQEQRAKDSQVVKQTFEGIFQSAGMNPLLFTGTSKDDLKATIQKDAAFVFKHLNLVINFYNLAINNLYNFNPYQARINILPITAYDEVEKVNMYLEAAAYGIGKLEAVVAVGIKQKDIFDKHVLEKYLDLDKILVPLQSAHTSSGKNDTKETVEPKPESDNEEVVKTEEEEEST